MRKGCLIVPICALLGTWANPAAATVIDFEDLPDAPFASYTEAGVTFTAVDGALLQKFGDMPNGTWGLTGLEEPYSELRADFADGATFVAVDLGDYAGVDAETIFLEIFDSTGASLGSISEDIPKDLMHMTTLSLSAPYISYAIFGSRNSEIFNGSSVPADNFTFYPCPSAVPAPRAILLGTIGAGLIGHLRRRGVLG